MLLSSIYLLKEIAVSHTMSPCSWEIFWSVLYDTQFSVTDEWLHLTADWGQIMNRVYTPMQPGFKPDEVKPIYQMLPTRHWSVPVRSIEHSYLRARSRYGRVFIRSIQWNDIRRRMTGFMQMTKQTWLRQVQFSGHLKQENIDVRTMKRETADTLNRLINYNCQLQKKILGNLQWGK